MPYPTTKSTPTSIPTISRPLPLRSYQDTPPDTFHSSSSSWSTSQSSAHIYSSFSNPTLQPPAYNATTLIPTLPLRSPLRPQPHSRTRHITRPHAPSAVLPPLNARGADLDNDFADVIHSPITTSSTSSCSSSSLRSLPLSPLTPTSTATSTSSPTTRHKPSTSTAPNTPPICSKWLTPAHQQYLSSRALASTSPATSPPLPPTPPCFPPSRPSGPGPAFPLPPRSLLRPPPPPRPRHVDDCQDRSGDSYSPRLGCDERGLELRSGLGSELEMEAADLSLCNMSGWRCVARRARTSVGMGAVCGGNEGRI